MSDAFETVPAASDRDRSLLKRLQNIARRDGDDTDQPLSNGVSGTGINLIAAAVAANADFSFSGPASADEKSDGDHRGDGTVNTDASEGGRADTEGQQDDAQGAINEPAVNGVGDGEQPKGDDTKSADKFAPGDVDASAPNNSQALLQHEQDAAQRLASKHHGTSTSPNLLGHGSAGDGTAVSAASASGASGSSAIPTLVTADADADSSGGTTFHVSNIDAGQFISIVGAAETSSTSTVDLSHLQTSAPVVHTIKIVADNGHAPADVTMHGIDTAPTLLKLNVQSTHNGVYVDLGRPIETINTSDGKETVNVVTLKADGTIDKAVAHVAHVDNVIGTTGNDTIVGNGHANTITYTADDDAQHATAGGDGTGAGANYGFDIVSGGPDPFSGHAHEKASDAADTLDMSHVGSQDGAVEAAGNGQHAEILSGGAQGIQVDLERSITIETVNPHTGEATQITGTLVSTTGGTERTDLALIVWAAPAHETTPGEMVATIENIIGSHGADAVSGDSRDNTYTVIGAGACGPSTFDGRGGTDTIDFSKLSLPGSGVEIHLAASASGSGSDGANSGSASSGGSGPDSGSAVATENSGNDQGPGTAIVILTNVENITGSKGNDVIEGNSADNILTGILGSDVFIFKSTILVDGMEYANIGNDEITDYNNYQGSSGHGSGHDSLWLSNVFFHFDSGMSSSDKLNSLFDNYAHDENGSTVIRIDSHNSIRLDNMGLNEARLYFSDTFYFI